MILLLTEGRVSDCRGAATVLPALPEAERLIAGRGYDSDWFREALGAKHIEPCIPGRKNRKRPIDCDKALYKRRNLIERTSKPRYRSKSLLYVDDLVDRI